MIDRPGRTDDVRGGRSDASQRHHVEDDVEQAAVQPHGAQERPPGAITEHRNGAARPEQDQGAAGRGQEIDRRRPSSPPDEKHRQQEDQRRTAPMTSGTKPRSLPNWRMSGAKPHKPGFARPHCNNDRR